MNQTRNEQRSDMNLKLKAEHEAHRLFCLAKRSFHGMELYQEIRAIVP